MTRTLNGRWVYVTDRYMGLDFGISLFAGRTDDSHWPASATAKCEMLVAFPPARGAVATLAASYHQPIEVRGGPSAIQSAVDKRVFSGPIFNPVNRFWLPSCGLPRLSPTYAVNSATGRPQATGPNADRGNLRRAVLPHR